MKENLYKVWLSLIRRVSIENIEILLNYFGSFEEIYNAGETDYAAAGFTKSQLLLDKDLKRARDICDKCLNYGIDIMTYFDEEYPRLLKNIPNPPFLLYIKGKMPDFDNRLSVAVVGARKSDDYGQKASFEFAKVLAENGVIIVSGMARGIDTESHKGALSVGGSTVAVLGCGVDRCYPPENREIKRMIESSCAVISEYPPGAPPLGKHFPVRNRIISGLALATLVVEGDPSSGSLITGHAALEQGREVFAIPGDVNSKLSAAPHRLIREGARLVSTPAEMLADLTVSFPEYMYDVMWKEKEEKSKTNPKLESLSSDQKLIYNVLSPTKPITIDEICFKTSLEISVVNQNLLMMEIEGLVKSLPGRKYITGGSLYA